jgi:hypothetical protein
MQRHALPALAIAAACLLAGCAGYRHDPYRLDDKSPVSEERFDLYFVEADDEGWFWESDQAGKPGQATKALDAVKDSANVRNTFVLLFVHGWHHSAECCDSNVESFKETLKRLHVELTKEDYREARKEKSAADFKLIGIYLGWRGRSLPGPLDYFTFWGRKSAAERVGETDVREFIARLNRIYLDHDSREHFLGLISIGHSFGAQVLVRAMTSTLEQELVQLNPSPGYLRQRVPAASGVDEVGLLGIGDLVILLNPATEAAAYHRLHLLSMGLRYRVAQTPVLITFSAENDKARQKLFTIGRVLGEFFTGKAPKADLAERETERKALGIDGEYVKHVTHRIQPHDPNARLVEENIERDAEDYCQMGGKCVAEWRKWADASALQQADDTITAGDERLSTFDFSSDLRLGNVDLKRGPGAIERQPLIVATASKAIIDDHSGVFTDPFLQFLIPYIALIESKIAMNVDDVQDRKERARTR